MIVSGAACATLLAGCGGDDGPQSDADKAKDVAKQYVHTHSNNEEAKCRGLLATGVDPKLCDDLGPLVSRNNPEVEKAGISGSTAKVTVTGAGPTLIDVTLRKQGGDWKVVKWRGYAKGSAAGSD
jgi:hypothetical protein